MPFLQVCRWQPGGGEQSIQLRMEGPRPAEGMGWTRALSNLAKTNIESYTREAEPFAVLRVGMNWFQAVLLEKFLEFAVVSKLNMSLQCVSATEMANCLLTCRNKRRAHSRNQNNCLFPFTCHSLECYKATLSSLRQLHPVKTSRKSIIE